VPSPSCSPSDTRLCLLSVPVPTFQSFGPSLLHPLQAPVSLNSREVQKSPSPLSWSSESRASSFVMAANRRNTGVFIGNIPYGRLHKSLRLLLNFVPRRNLTVHSPQAFPKTSLSRLSAESAKYSPSASSTTKIPASPKDLASANSQTQTRLPQPYAISMTMNLWDAS
jgi:hypothetical protein